MSAVPQLVQVLLAHSEMVADLVEDGGADLVDELGLAVAAELDVFLEDVDDVRQTGGVFDAALGQRAAVVETEEQFVVRETEAALGSAGGPQ